MKKILIIAALLCSSIVANAQFYTGIGYTNMRFKGIDPDDRVVTSYQGFDVEAGYDFYITEAFGLVTALRGDFYAMTNARYVDLSLPVRAKMYFGDSITRVFLFAGPSFTYSLFGKSWYLDGWHDDFDDENRFNVYLGGGLGFEYDEHYVIRIGYDFGLINTAIKRSENFKYNNFNVSIAYKF